MALALHSSNGSNGSHSGTFDYVPVAYHDYDHVVRAEIGGVPSDVALMLVVFPSGYSSAMLLGITPSCSVLREGASVGEEAPLEDKVQVSLFPPGIVAELKPQESPARYALACMLQRTYGLPTRPAVSLHPNRY